MFRPHFLRIAMPAGGGAADDVFIFDASCPFHMRLVDAYMIISTSALLSTIQMRRRAGNSGALIFGQFNTGNTGIVRPDATTGTALFEPNDTLVARRSNSSVVGEIILSFV